MGKKALVVGIDEYPDNPFDGMNAVLSKGLTILSATRPEETALEIAGHEVFTTLLCSALNGGAADLLGHITPGSIYALQDGCLGISWVWRCII